MISTETVALPDNDYGMEFRRPHPLPVLCKWAILKLGNFELDHSCVAPVPAGMLTSVLTNDANREPVKVDAFAMRTTPVTNAEFRAFIQAHPEWQRGQAPAIFVDRSYLHQWQSAVDSRPGLDAMAPVTSVSWFAAQAFCESENARLPTWLEWEYVAAADDTHADARSNPAWRARILSWYTRSSNKP